MTAKKGKPTDVEPLQIEAGVSAGRTKLAKAAEAINEQKKDGRFKRGQAGGPGRPKGTRNKLQSAFTDALYADFKEHGETAIQVCREFYPDKYLGLMAKFIDKNVNVNQSGLIDELRALTPEQLRDELASTIEEVLTTSRGRKLGKRELDKLRRDIAAGTSGSSSGTTH